MHLAALLQDRDGWVVNMHKTNGPAAAEGRRAEAFTYKEYYIDVKFRINSARTSSKELGGGQ